MSASSIFRRKGAANKSGRQEDADISAEALLDINDSLLGAVRALPRDEIDRRINEVSLDRAETDAEIARANEILDREGIVIIRNFLDASTLDVAEAAFSRLDAALAQSSSEQNFEDDAILVQSAERVVKAYGDLAAHPKTVATVRGGADAGMIDTFHFDKLAGAQREALRAPFAQDWLLKSIAVDGEIPTPRNLNLYLNRSVRKTRGFHADTYTKMLKGFVYLSDVDSLDTGPYCFVRKSHVAGPWRTMNQAIGQHTKAATEAPFVDLREVTPVLAPKGALVVSDQAGFHRGIPQAEGAERRVLVMAYR